MGKLVMCGVWNELTIKELSDRTNIDVATLWDIIEAQHLLETEILTEQSRRNEESKNWEKERRLRKGI